MKLLLFMFNILFVNFELLFETSLVSFEVYLYFLILALTVRVML